MQKYNFTECTLSLTVSKGHSAFRLIANENEWNVVAASLFTPNPFKVREFYIQGATLEYLRTTESTRLAVVFCPAWAVSLVLKKAKEKPKGKAKAKEKGMDLKRWTWVFSDFGNQEVKQKPYDAENEIEYGYV